MTRIPSPHQSVLCLWLALLTGIVWPAAAVGSGREAQRLLTRMSEATRSLSYHGTFVSVRGSRVAMMRIVHRGDVGGEQERLISLMGPAKEVIRRNDEVTCIFPRDRAVVVDRRPPRQFLGATLSRPVETLAAYYDFSVLGGDRIAGRPASVLGIVPKTPDRYGYRLWVDSESDLLLKSEVIDGGGEVVEQVLFTDLKVRSSIPEAWLKPGISGQGYSWYTGGKRTARALSSPEWPRGQWQIRWIPPGFMMQEDQTRAMADGTEPVKHAVYSDGLASVSVFTEKATEATERIEGHSSMGALNSYSTWADGYQVTVLGEVPATTVRQIAASVAFVPARP
jgi:sigma-E factor negative regulatory protein RseB